MKSIWEGRRSSLSILIPTHFIPSGAAHSTAVEKVYSLVNRYSPLVVNIRRAISNDEVLPTVMVHCQS